MTSQETIKTHIPQKMTQAETWRLIAVCSAYFIVKGIWLQSCYTNMYILLAITTVPVLILETHIKYLYQQPISEPRKFIKIYLGTLIVHTLIVATYFFFYDNMILEPENIRILELTAYFMFLMAPTATVVLLLLLKYFTI